MYTISICFTKPALRDIALIFTMYRGEKGVTSNEKNTVR